MAKRTIGRRFMLPVAAAIVVIIACILTACGKSEFSATVLSEKRITIDAKNADEDATSTVGALEVKDGEKITIDGDLKKGSVRVELFRTDGQQSMDQLPDMDGEPVMSANLNREDNCTGTVPAGNYSVRATCLEKASGTVDIEVQQN